MPTEPKKTSTPTLISALRILAGEIESPDGVANMTIAEGADRIAEMERELTSITAERNRYHDALIARHGGEPIALLSELDEARYELAALLRDKERLDWLEGAPTERLAETRRIIWQQRDTSTAVRAAIDAAMKGGSDE